MSDLRKIINDAWIQTSLQRLMSKDFADYANDKFSVWLKEKGLYNLDDGDDIVKKVKKMDAEERDGEQARLENWFENWDKSYSLDWFSKWIASWKGIGNRKNRWRCYEPWNVGSKKILKRLTRSVLEYRTKYYSNAKDVSQNAELRLASLLFVRLFYCWFSHCEENGDDADSTLDRWERSEFSELPNAVSGTSDKKRRNSNPLEEIVLLDDMTSEWKHDETRAMERFQQQYGPFCICTVQKRWKKWAPDPFVNYEETDWWSGLYYKLVGLHGLKPSSYAYRGDGLKSWLVCVIHTYFRETCKVRKLKDGDQWQSSLPVNETDCSGFEDSNSRRLEDAPAYAPTPEFMSELTEFMSALPNVRTILEEQWKRFDQFERFVLLYGCAHYDHKVEVETSDKEESEHKSRRLIENFLDYIQNSKEIDRELLAILGKEISKKVSKTKERVVKALQALPEAGTQEERRLLGQTIYATVVDLSKRFPVNSNDILLILENLKKSKK